MRYEQFSIKVYQIGDRVQTPKGIGTVLENEEYDRHDLGNRTIKVRLHGDNANYLNGRTMNAWDVILIEK